MPQDLEKNSVCRWVFFIPLALFVYLLFLFYPLHAQSQKYEISNVADSDRWVTIEFQFRVSDSYDAYTNKAEADKSGPNWVREIFRLKGVEAMKIFQHRIEIAKASSAKIKWRFIVPEAAEIVVKAKTR